MQLKWTQVVNSSIAENYMKKRSEQKFAQTQNKNEVQNEYEDL